MKKQVKIFLIIIFAMLTLLFFSGKVQAKSYNIQDMDIQATVQQDGSVDIEQKLTYQFNDSYNGIYINVPYQLEDLEHDEVIKQDRINDNLYNASEVVVKGVSLLSNGSYLNFKQTETAMNGNSMVYTTTTKDGKKEIKVFSPSTNATKTFKINYTLKNLCVKHNDVAELYYNFIGGAWETEIKNLNIDIYLPQNNSQIKVWGHGPYNGNSKIISNTHANFKVTNVKPGQYVAARVLFDKICINASTKVSNIDAEDFILKDEQSIYQNKEKKNAFTTKIIIFAVCLLIYWIILMFAFEKDKKYKVTNINEEELFEKYNPMLAGCIQGSRTILARDIIAVILGLINKKIIKLDIQNNLTGKDNYAYNISKNAELEDKMDNIEKYVYDWIFDNKETVNLTKRLQEMPKEYQASQKFRDLNKIVEKELASRGANQAKVPLIVRGFNIFLFILSLVLIFKHLIYNGLNIYDAQKSSRIIMHLGTYIIAAIPLIMGILCIPINLIVITRHKVNKTVQRITGQKVVTTTISLIVLFSFIILLTTMFSPVKFLIADEVLICIATILILTDNLMLKNNAIMIEDYSKLNCLKQKIEKYTIMQDRDVEQVVLWEQYLSYAVSFGVANKIIKRIKGLNLDDDLTGLVNNRMFSNYITSDYYWFYRYASLDRRFARAYGHATGKVLESMLDSDSSGGRRRWLFWRWRIFWRRRKRPEAAEPSKGIRGRSFFPYF